MHVAEPERVGAIWLVETGEANLRAVAHGTPRFDFIAAPFREHGGHIRFEFRELSKASAALLQRKIDGMAADFNEMAELDGTLPSSQRVAVGFMLATRPWDIESITGLRRR